MTRHGVIGRLPAAISALVAAAGIAAAPAQAQTLRQELHDALMIAGVSRAKTGALALDLEKGRVVYGWQRDRSFRPASNEKLGVALTVLDRLGPDYRLRTEVLGSGSLTGSTWQGGLVLRGFGDPTLRSTDLDRLAAKLRTKGIRRVTGRISGDETYFDRRRTADGWRSSYYKDESPPLSALVVDRARVNGRTRDNPALWAAKAFRKALLAAGIDVAGRAVRSAAPQGSVTLVSVRSQTTRALVRRMNKVSDNFYAEMLVKHLGAAVRGEGSTEAGCIVIRRELDQRGVPLAGVRIVDGSGLSRLDRATARALGRLLVSAYGDPAVRAPFFSSLPIAGVDGTLEERMRTGAARGRVRAKTGTTSSSSALSGYVGTRYVFAILQNGSPVNWTQARRSQDRFARVLARRL